MFHPDHLVVLNRQGRRFADGAESDSISVLPNPKSSLKFFSPRPSERLLPSKQPRALPDEACCSLLRRAQHSLSSVDPWRCCKTSDLVRQHSPCKPGQDQGRHSCRSRYCYEQETLPRARAKPSPRCSCGGFQQRCQVHGHSRCSARGLWEAVARHSQ